MDEPKPFIGHINLTISIDGRTYRILINPIGLTRNHGKNTVCVTRDDVDLIYQNYFDDVSHIIENPLAWWTMEKL